MLSNEFLDRAKKIALADVNYGEIFRDVPFLNSEDAIQRLEPADILIEYIPQFRPNIIHYNEFLLKGLMHIGIVVRFGETFYKIELLENGLFCDRCIFSQFEPFEHSVKRFFIVVRSKKVSSDDLLKKSLNASIINYAGYENREGNPVKMREIKTNFFLRTHKLDKNVPLPDKLYCSELAYLAYLENGIEICKLRSLDELADMTGGFPARKDTKRILTHYSRGSMFLYSIFFLIAEYERLTVFLNLRSLGPSGILFKDGVWPNFIVENKDFDIVCTVPPYEMCIKEYEQLMSQKV